MENILDRLSKYMKINALNNNIVTVKAGLSNGLLGNAFKSGKGLNSDSIEKILYSYTDLDADWLLTGRGDMLKQTSTSAVVSHAAAPIESYGNIGNMYTQQLEKENRRLIAEVERKQEMLDSFMSGDIIIKKETG